MKLGELGQFQTGGTPSRSRKEYFEGEIPWISTPSLNGSWINDTDAVERITPLAVENSATKLIPEGSLMVGIRVGVGKVAINSVPMCTNQDIVSISNIDSSKWAVEYLSQAVQAQSGKLLAQKRGATISGITTKVLKDLSIPIRTIEKQREIVSRIDTTAHLIEALRAQLTKLDDLVKSQFVEMFGDVASPSVKWPTAPLGNLCKLITGNTPSTKCDEFYNHKDIQFIKPGDIGDAGQINIPTAETWISQAARDKARIVPPGTVLMTCIGIIGKVGITTSELAFNQQINAAIPGDALHPCYLAYCLLQKASGVRQQANQAVVPILNKSAFASLSIPLPPLALQQQFADFVARVDKLGFDCCRMTTYCDALFSSVSARLLRTQR